jgi:hypothetical protein
MKYRSSFFGTLNAEEITFNLSIACCKTTSIHSTLESLILLLGSIEEYQSTFMVSLSPASLFSKLSLPYLSG